MISKADDTKLEILKEYRLKADLEDVWDCLSNGDVSSVWQDQDCEIGDKTGDELSLFGGWVRGKIISRVEKKEISYTWYVTEWGDNTTPSTVKYQLSKAEDKTLVKLSHTNLPNQKERDDHDKGWDEQFFNPMKQFLEV